MAFVHLLLAALAATAVFAEDKPCECVNQDQVYNSISAPLMFFQQPTVDGTTAGATCTKNCIFTAKLDVDDENYSLQINVLTDNKLGDGSIIFTGLNATNNVITSTTPTGILPYLSFGDTITLNFTQPDGNKGEFMVVVQKVKGRAPAPLVKTTTQAPPTAPYDPKFNHNPRLVANDIMLTFDLSSPYLEKFKTFARDLIKELAINPLPIPNEGDPKEPEDCEDGSRLTVVGLSSNSGFNTNYAPYWTTTYEQADGNINVLFQMGTGPFYYGPVDTKYAYGFGKDQDDNVYTTCKNRGKIFVLFTSSSPVECDQTLSECGSKTKTVPVTNFLDKGVHQILVNYNMPPENMMYYNLYNATTEDKAWNYFSMTGGDKDVENFFNQFLVDTSDQMTCQLKSGTTQTTVEIGKATVTIDIPNYYNAKGKDDGTWVTDRHYCNFQETTIKLIREKTITGKEKTPTCVKVFYDLETGKDFVSIYYNEQETGIQKEIVRLTGSDVSGTTFDLPDAYGSIVFSSDEKNVFDGFHAEITVGECS